MTYNEKTLFPESRAQGRDFIEGFTVKGEKEIGL